MLACKLVNKTKAIIHRQRHALRAMLFILICMVVYDYDYLNFHLN